MVDVKFHPRQLNEIEPRFAHARVPLTRHMFATWSRFGLRSAFHIRSDANRFAFITWYLWEHLPQRSYRLDDFPPSLLSMLNEPVPAHQPVSMFMLSIWQRYFRAEQKYDIFTEDGYYRFIHQFFFNEVHTRAIPSELIPTNAIENLNTLQPGFPGGHLFITRGLFAQWNCADTYKQKYPDLQNVATLQSFLFDQFIHLCVGHGRFELFPPECLQFWKEPTHPDFPRLSRFLFHTARYSSEFAEELQRQRLSSDLYQRIVRWFDTEALADHPALGELVPQSVPPEFSKGRRDDPMLFANKRVVTWDQLAPAFVTGSDDEIDVLLIGPYFAPTGLGSGVRRSADALRRAGCNFRVLNLSYDSPFFASLYGESVPLYRGEQATLNLWHFNAEYIYEVLTLYYRLAAGRHNIGYFFWETETLPIPHELGQSVVDEIWVPSKFVAEIYASAGVRVVNVGTSVALEDVGPYYDRAYFQIPEDEVVFLFSFDAHSAIQRKNPAATVRAFLKAFGKTDYRVRLIIKTQNMLTAHWPQVNGVGEEFKELVQYDIGRITLIDRTMSLRELYSLKSCCDCYVSLHRCEGFGYGPAEAMALGKPVIMTDYSANTEFGNQHNALMVPAKLIPVLPEEYLYWTPGMQWADPDVDVAAEHMARIYLDPESRQRIGVAAKESILRNFGPEAMGRRYRNRLVELGVFCGGAEMGRGRKVLA